MISLLSGNEDSVEAVREAIGQKILRTELCEDELLLVFESGLRLALFDEGQSCCESRYMRTDDALDSIDGHTLVGIEVADGPETELAGEVQEVQFLRVTTDRGLMTISSHNDHNGYYGGISIRAQKVA